MHRITGLNEKRKSIDQDENLQPKEPPQEVLEAGALAKYNEALLLQKQKKFIESTELYNEVLALPIVAKAEPAELGSKALPDGRSPIYGKTALSLKYLSLKNLAEICRDTDKDDDAVSYYLQALDVDETDVMVWYQMAVVSWKLGNIRFSSRAFLLGFEQSPKNWLCLDRAAVSHYVQGDFFSTIHIIAKRFEKDSNYPRGYLLRDLIFNAVPSLKTDLRKACPNLKLNYDIMYEGSIEEKEQLTNEIKTLRGYYEAGRLRRIKKAPEKMSLKKHLTKLSWVALGESLRNLHVWFETPDEDVSIMTPVDLLENIPASSACDVASIEPSATVNEPELDEPKEEVQAPELLTTDEVIEEKRAAKRRSGTALMEELLWSGKRRSARVRCSRKEQESLSVADALKNILPRKLLHRMKNHPRTEAKNVNDDSMDTMDLYRLFEKQGGSDDHGQKSDEENSEVEWDHDKSVKEEGYFNTLQEQSDIKEFVEQENLRTVYEISRSYVLALEKHWRKTWPKALVYIYMDCHRIMRRFNPVSEDITVDESGPPPWLPLCCSDLLFHELAVDNAEGSLEKVTSEMYMNDMTMACEYEQHFPGQYDFYVYRARLIWMRAHLAMNLSLSSDVIYYLEKLLEIFKVKALEGKSIRLKNCRKNSLINADMAQASLDAQSRKRSLAEVIRLYEDGSYRELVDILRETFKNTSLSVLPDSSQAETYLEPQTQLAMLINALYSLNEFKECVYWLELSCHELMRKVSTTCQNFEEKESQEWKVDFDRLLVSIESCCEMGNFKITNALPLPRLSRFVQTLCHAICRQSEDCERPPCASRPWIALHRILVAIEEDANRLKNYDDDDLDIPASVLILFTAHEYLGRREWCNCDGNAVLFLIMDQVIPRLRQPEWGEFRETAKQHVEQVVFCLYGHPSKKSKARYLTDHNVSPIDLTWERAIQLFDLFRPDETPSFNSKSSAKSAETEGIFRRIAMLIPDEIDPAKSCSSVKEFIYGKAASLPEPIKLPDIVKELFYLLGDYYCHVHEFGKAVNYLMIDLCANPCRVDSWASMALSRGAQLESKLNCCDPIRNEEFLDEAISVIRCYEHCLSLDQAISELWIEYGNFSYTIHSFCSQRMKLESDSLSLEQFEEMESTKTKMLERAKNAFLNASNLWNKAEDDTVDERWLHHYMLGKVCEKHGDLSYLEHYEKAAHLLYENNALYPKKISYNSPPKYAIESMEVFYRVHVCVIKCLELHDGEPLEETTRDSFMKTLKIFAEGPFSKQMSKLDLLRQIAKEEDEQELERVLVFQMINDIIDEIIDKVTEEPVDTEAIEENPMNSVEVPLATSTERKPDEELKTSNEDVVDAPSDTVTKEETMDVYEEKAEVKEDELVIEEDKTLAKKTETNEIEDKLKMIEPMETNELNEKPQKFDSGEVTAIPDKPEEIDEKSFESDLLKLAENVAERFKVTDPEAAALQYAPPVAPVEEPKVYTFEPDPIYDQEFVENDYLTLDDFNAPIQPKNTPKVRSDFISNSEFRNSIHAKVGKKRRCTRTLSEGSSGSSSSEDIKYADESSGGSTPSTPATSRSRTASSSSSSSQVDDLKRTEEKTTEGKKPEDDKPASAEVKDVDKSVEKKDEEVQPKTPVSPEQFILQQCLKAFETCALRFPQHYKSVYRLAHFFYRSKSHRDLIKCRNLLLGQYPTEDGVISGLFSEKKNTNFFNGIWRLPSGDVDRPGNFTSHMSRSVLLLLEVLRDTRDHKLLIELCLQLRKVPEPDKRYLREDERVQLSKQAFTLSIQTLRQILRQPEEITMPLVLDIFKLYRKLQKHYPAKDGVFAECLMEAFKRFVKSDRYSLDQCLRFCQGELTGNPYKLPQPQSESKLPQLQSESKLPSLKVKPRKSIKDDGKVSTKLKMHKVPKLMEPKEAVVETKAAVTSVIVKAPPALDVTPVPPPVKESVTEPKEADSDLSRSKESVSIISKPVSKSEAKVEEKSIPIVIDKPYDKPVEIPVVEKPKEKPPTESVSHSSMAYPNIPDLYRQANPFAALQGSLMDPANFNNDAYLSLVANYLSSMQGYPEKRKPGRPRKNKFNDSLWQSLPASTQPQKPLTSVSPKHAHIPQSHYQKTGSSPTISSLLAPSHAQKTGSTMPTHSAHGMAQKSGSSSLMSSLSPKAGPSSVMSTISSHELAQKSLSSPTMSSLTSQPYAPKSSFMSPPMAHSQSHKTGSSPTMPSYTSQSLSRKSSSSTSSHLMSTPMAQSLAQKTGLSSAMSMMSSSIAQSQAMKTLLEQSHAHKLLPSSSVLKSPTGFSTKEHPSSYSHLSHLMQPPMSRKTPYPIPKKSGSHSSYLPPSMSTTPPKVAHSSSIPTQRSLEISMPPPSTPVHPKLASPDAKTKFNIEDILKTNSGLTITPSTLDLSSGQTEAINLSPNRKAEAIDSARLSSSRKSVEVIESSESCKSSESDAEVVCID